MSRPSPFAGLAKTLEMQSEIATLVEALAAHDLDAAKAFVGRLAELVGVRPGGGGRKPAGSDAFAQADASG